tara:strand:- start:207 stop:968 length:762 start_codon:yes stop_codon:yes gene_type:complete
MKSCIYNGHVSHSRFKPIKHFLKYNIFSLLLDLDELEILEKKIPIFSCDKFNIFSFYNKDHGERDGTKVKDWVFRVLKKYKIENDIDNVKLLCYPRIFGYVFNPLSIFYCYKKDKLEAIFYEVKNTFNEQHTYIFKIKNNSNLTQQCDKKFYVSPFMDMATSYYFEIKNPAEDLYVFIKQSDKEGAVLTAMQKGKKKNFSSKQLLINFMKYPLMTLKIIGAIHFEALRLWKKGAKYRGRDQKIKNNLSYEGEK